MSVNHWRFKLGAISHFSFAWLSATACLPVCVCVQVFPDVVNTCTDDGRRAGRACGGTCCYFTRDEWDSHHFSLGCWKSRNKTKKNFFLSWKMLRVLSPFLSWAMIYSRLSCWKGRIWKIASLDWQMPSDSSSLSLSAGQWHSFLSLVGGGCSCCCWIIVYSLMNLHSVQQASFIFDLKGNCCCCNCYSTPNLKIKLFHHQKAGWIVFWNSFFRFVLFLFSHRRRRRRDSFGCCVCCCKLKHLD